MPETAQRRLVKSPPEIWSEISDAQSLARRLSALGAVRITRIEPETAVAWEGASIRGTVELEASGWGTKVTLTAEREAEQVQTGPEVEPYPEPELRDAASASAAQDTAAFDSSVVARVRAAEPEPVWASESEPEAAAEPAEQTCAEAEATGTDIPPQAPSPAPREEGFLARLKGWWHSERRDARPAEAPAPGGEPAAAEAPAARAELQPPATEAPGTEPAAAEAPARQPELQPPRAEADRATQRLTAPEVEPDVRAEGVIAAAETPANHPELQPPRAEADRAWEPNPAGEADGDAVALRDPELEGLLVRILDDLGAAHHRPFSRA